MDTPQIMEENGKRYRMLQVRETIELGDAFRYSDYEWVTCDEIYVGTPITDPERNGAFPQGYYRRPIQ